MPWNIVLDEFLTVALLIIKIPALKVEGSLTHLHEKATARDNSEDYTTGIR
jgi:hypothetical protein